MVGIRILQVGESIAAYGDKAQGCGADCPTTVVRSIFLFAECAEFESCRRAHFSEVMLHINLFVKTDNLGCNQAALPATSAELFT